MRRYCERLPIKRVDRPNWTRRLQSGIACNARNPVLKPNRSVCISFNSSNRIRICKIFHSFTSYALEREIATFHDPPKSFKKGTTTARSATNEICRDPACGSQSKLTCSVD